MSLMSGPPPFGEMLVTLANWQDPPYNRWSFQHVRELIPTARIARGPVASELPSAPADLGAVSFTHSGRELTIDDMLTETFTDGFLVLHKGQVVYERYLNGMQPDTPHLLMSVSKSVVATVAGILVERGVLAVSEAVTAIVPQLAGTSFDGATVQQLLDMRTGTQFDEDYENVESDARTYERVYLWRPDDARPRATDALSYYPTLVNNGEHGGPFRYRSILTDVLGWVVERAAGSRLHEVISELLWAPMGAEHDAEITVDARGNAMADGGMCATLRDLARFGAQYLPGGFVSDVWRSDTAQGAPDGAAAFVTGERPAKWPEDAHYRNCWWVRDPSAPFLMAAGIYGQNIYVMPVHDLVIAKFSTWPTPTSPTFEDLTTSGIDALAAASAHEPSSWTR